MVRLVEALGADLERRSVRIIRGTAALSLHQSAEGWTVTTAGEDIEADRVLVATPGDIAVELLANAVNLPKEEWTGSATVSVVSIAITDERLDSAPRGSGVLRSQNETTIVARAMTHSSAKWPWLAELLPKSHHLMRLSYDPSVLGSPSEVELKSLVARDASLFLGFTLDPETVSSVVRTDWTTPLPYLAPGQRARRERLVAALAEYPGLAIAGSWVSGTGLAAVVKQAQTAADSLAPA